MRLDSGRPLPYDLQDIRNLFEVTSKLENQQIKRIEITPPSFGKWNIKCEITPYYLRTMQSDTVWRISFEMEVIIFAPRHLIKEETHLNNIPIFGKLCYSLRYKNKISNQTY